jgi:hypothetical protein
MYKFREFIIYIKNSIEKYIMDFLSRYSNFKNTRIWIIIRIYFRIKIIFIFIFKFVSKNIYIRIFISTIIRIYGQIISDQFVPLADSDPICAWLKFAEYNYLLQYIFS